MEGGKAMRRMPDAAPWQANPALVALDDHQRLLLAAQAVQRLAELGVGLADVRHALVDRIANLPPEENWLGFEHSLSDLDRLALQADALYTYLIQVVGASTDEQP